MDAEEREKAYAQAGVVAPPERKSATDQERSLLRSSVVREATTEEADAWVSQNIRFLSEKAKNAFVDMNAKDKFRVMSEGSMHECRDSTDILYGRVKRFMDMEAKLRSMANSDPNAVEKPKEKIISSVARSIAQQMSMPKLEEVPEHERRTGFAVGTGPPEEAPKAPEKPKVGTRKGVGGVIEALQKKYTMEKGERAKVISETKELWKIEGDRNVPKVHCNTGWKWVLQGDEAAAKKKAEVQAQKQQEKQDAEKKKADEEMRKKGERTEETAKKSKDSQVDGHRKSRRRSSSRSAASPSKSRRRSKSLSKRKKQADSSDEPSSKPSRAHDRKKRSRKCSRSSSSRSRDRRRRK